MFTAILLVFAFILTVIELSNEKEKDRKWLLILALIIELIGTTAVIMFALTPEREVREIIPRIERTEINDTDTGVDLPLHFD